MSHFKKPKPFCRCANCGGVIRTGQPRSAIVSRDSNVTVKDSHNKNKHPDSHYDQSPRRVILGYAHTSELDCKAERDLQRSIVRPNQPLTFKTVANPGGSFNLSYSKRNKLPQWLREIYDEGKKNS